MNEFEEKIKEFYHPDYVNNIDKIIGYVNEKDYKQIMASYGSVQSKGKYMFKNIKYNSDLKHFVLEYIDEMNFTEKKILI
jgi:hypothetical protein